IEQMRATRINTARGNRFIVQRDPRERLRVVVGRIGVGDAQFAASAPNNNVAPDVQGQAVHAWGCSSNGCGGTVDDVCLAESIHVEWAALASGPYRQNSAGLLLPPAIESEYFREFQRLQRAAV